MSSALHSVPPHAPFWCLPWSGIDTKMPVLGVGNPDPRIAKRIFDLGVKTGVYEKVIQCEAFLFRKPQDGMVFTMISSQITYYIILNLKELTVIDYDLVQVGAAVMDFGCHA